MLCIAGAISQAVKLYLLRYCTPLGQQILLGSSAGHVPYILRTFPMNSTSHARYEHHSEAMQQINLSHILMTSFSMCKLQEDTPHGRKISIF